MDAAPILRKAPFSSRAKSLNILGNGILDFSPLLFQNVFFLYGTVLLKDISLHIRIEDSPVNEL